MSAPIQENISDTVECQIQSQKICQKKKKKNKSSANRMSTTLSASTSEKMTACMSDRISEHMKIHAMSECIPNRILDKMRIQLNGFW